MPKERLMESSIGMRRYLPYAMVLLGYVAGMGVDIMEIDAVQYANIARTMLERGDYLHIYDQGHGYLDKPPLTFWMSALSFKLFGISNWAYRLPSLLFTLAAIWGTVRLAGLLHGPRVGFLAGIVLASAQAFFLMNNDVKTDMYLIAPMVLGVWLTYARMRGGPFWLVPLAGLCYGLALLGKGPIGLVLPGLAVLGDLVLRRDWRNLFRLDWVVVLVVALLTTLPFDIGLYEQYGWRGVEFFFWTQSFGRVTGQSEWANDATPFFYVHTFAWAFLPWTLFFVVALGKSVLGLWRSRLRLAAGADGLAVSGLLLGFAALSLSRFKLPHYIFVVLPFAAILVAAWLDGWLAQGPERPGRRLLAGVSWSMWALGALLTGTLLFWAFAETALGLKVAFVVAVMAIGADALRSREAWVRLLWPTALGFASFNLFINLAIYPPLLENQSTSQAGQFIRHNFPEQKRLFAHIVGGRSIDFYAQSAVLPLPALTDVTDSARVGDYLMYTNDDGLGNLERLGLQYEVLDTFPQHSPNKLTLPYLNPATRAQHCAARYVVHVPQQQRP